MFEEQAVIKPKSSAHSHRSSAQDEDKVPQGLHDLHKLKPFSTCGHAFIYLTKHIDKTFLNRVKMRTFGYM